VAFGWRSGHPQQAILECCGKAGVES
jgi:hypothetical protein